MPLPAHSLLLVLSIAAPAPVAERDPPRCGPQAAGQVACLAGTRCLCQYDPGGTLTARPPGFRWDCGVLRPPCDAPPASGDPPSEIPVPPPLPWR